MADRSGHASASKYFSGLSSNLTLPRYHSADTACSTLTLDTSASDAIQSARLPVSRQPGPAEHLGFPGDSAGAVRLPADSLGQPPDDRALQPGRSAADFAGSGQPAGLCP